MKTSTSTPSVVIGVDGSKQAEDAFNWYFDHGLQEDHRIVLAHCVHPPAIYGVSDHYIYNDLIEQMKDNAHQTKKKYVELLKLRGVKGTFITSIEEKPGQWLARIAERENAALLVLGSRGHGLLSAMFRRAILGSVSNYVLHHARCAVAICHGTQVTFQRAQQIPKEHPGAARVTPLQARMRLDSLTGSVKSDISDAMSEDEAGILNSIQAAVP